jgi:hypothetical protein
MKKLYTIGTVLKASLALLFIVTVVKLEGQVPQGFNYQAIARDGSGNPITGATIKVKLSVLSDTLGFKASGAGVYVWEEEHINVKTNAFGLFTVVLGLGTKMQGSAGTFSAINWSSGPLFIGTKIFYPSTYKIMGSARLWTVPYAMTAGGVSGTIPKLGINGTTGNLDEALFEVKNNIGQTVFAVYSEGVRVYVDNGTAKGAKGGFAVGSFGSAKAPSQNLMTVSNDSVRIYVDETAAKGSKGGFAVGGFNTAKGTVNEFMFMTPDNYFVGHNSGTKIDLGKYNSTLGFESGQNLTNAWNNVFVGYKSGFSTTSGGSNVFLGNSAGYLNTLGNYNIFLGRSSGYNNTEGWGNIFLGDYSGYQTSTGDQNVIIGDLAGFNNTTGSTNVFLGASSGNANTTGSFNNYIGYQAGYNSSTGLYNTYIGYQSGYSSAAATGSNNIAMGSRQAILRLREAIIFQ